MQLDPSIAALSDAGSALTSSTVSNSDPARIEAMEKAAREFEAAFIGQMLTFSGLADAMTSGEGQMASAFSSFFIEALATDMAESGGLGLAEHVYKGLEARGGSGGRTHDE